MLSGAFALSRAESGILGPLQGWMIDKFGPKIMIRIGMLIFGSGFILFSRTESIFTYYLSFALMASGSSIAGFLTVASTVVNWFERRRGLAMGIAMSGFGVGGLLVPVIALSLTSFGWRSTAFFSGILVVLVGIPIAEIMRHRPEQYGYLPDGRDASTPEDIDDHSQQSLVHSQNPDINSIHDFTTKEAMRTPTFWLLSFGHSMALVTVGAVSLHLIPHIIDSVEISITGASSAVVVMTTCNILGQLCGGFLGDRFSKRWLAAVAMLVHSVALLILAFATTILPVFLFAVLHGSAWGVRGPLMTTIRADYFGRQSFATIMGFSSLIVMVGMTGGPLFAGIMADIFDGYRVGFIVISAVTGIGSLFFALARPPKVPQPLTQAQD